MMEDQTLANVADEAGIDIRAVAIDDILENDYNPNEMEQTLFESLVEAVRHEGMNQPILVRAHPDEPGKYLVVDGAHRYRAAKAVGLTKVAIVVVGYDENMAKVRTLSLNHVRGQDVPIKLARLIVDLQRTYSDKEIAAMTGIKEDEQVSVLALLEMPDFDLGDTQNAVRVAADEKSRPIELNLLLMPDEHGDYEAAMSKAMAYSGPHVTPLVAEEVADYDKAMREAMDLTGMKLRNVALASICHVFNKMPREYKEEAVRQIRDRIATRAAKAKEI